MKGKDRVLEGLSEFGRKIERSKDALVGELRGLGGTLAQKTSGVRSSLRRLVQGVRRSG
jgi:hypothetical protein